MDTRYISFEKNYVIIRIGNLLKTANKKHHTGVVKFPHFPLNKNICPVYCLTKYPNATKPRRDNITSLLTTLKPYKPISKDIVVR